MLKFCIIVNLLLIGAWAQDMPPPELEPPSTTTTTTTPEPTTQPTTPVNTTPAPEPVTTVQAATTTEVITDPPVTQTATEEPIITTTPEQITDPPPATTDRPEDNTHQKPVTDSPYWPASTTSRYPSYPYYPGYPDYSNQRCYFKTQSGRARYQWTCNGLEYVYPRQCYHCCLYQYATFAACYRVHAHYCNTTNQLYYK